MFLRQTIFRNILIFIFLLFQCSSNVALNHSPSQLVLVSIKPNNNISVHYFFNSKIQDPLQVKLPGVSTLNLNINEAFFNNLKTYLMAKFNKIEQDRNDNCRIEISLQSFDVSYELVQTTFQQLAGGGNNNAYANILINVKIINGGNEQVKNIMANSTTSNSSGSKSSVCAAATNEVIDKALILLDKYFTAIGI